MRLRFSSWTLLAALLAALASSNPAQAQSSGENKALGRPVTASSVERPERRGGCLTSRNGCAARNATDGDLSTRWGADWAEGQWLQIDLGSTRAVDQVEVVWEWSWPRRYRIETSLDGTSFSDVGPQVQPPFRPTLGQSHYAHTTTFAPRLARFVRITSVQRQWPQWGISIWEARVGGPLDPVEPPNPPAPPPAPEPEPPAPAQPPAASPASQPPSESPSAPAAGPPASPPAPRPAAPAPLRLLDPFPVVRLKGTFTPTGARIELLQIRQAGRATVRVVCRGERCPRRVVRQRGSGRVRAIRGFLPAGTRVDVLVTRSGRLGKHTRFVIRAGKPPLRRDRCVAPGSTRATSCAAAGR